MQHLKGQRRAPPKASRSQPRRPVGAHAQRCSKAAGTTGGGHHRSHRRAHHIAEPKASLPLVAGRCLWAPTGAPAQCRYYVEGAADLLGLCAALLPTPIRGSSVSEPSEPDGAIRECAQDPGHCTPDARRPLVRRPLALPCPRPAKALCSLRPLAPVTFSPPAQHPGEKSAQNNCRHYARAACRGQLDHRSLPESTRTSRQDNEARPCSSYAAAPWPGA